MSCSSRNSSSWSTPRTRTCSRNCLIVCGGTATLCLHRCASVPRVKSPTSTTTPPPPTRSFSVRQLSCMLLASRWSRPGWAVEHQRSESWRSSFNNSFGLVFAKEQPWFSGWGTDLLSTGTYLTPSWSCWRRRCSSAAKATNLRYSRRCLSL